MSKIVYIRRSLVDVHEEFPGSLNTTIIFNGYNTGLLKYYEVHGGPSFDYDYIEFTVLEMTFTPQNLGTQGYVFNEGLTYTYAVWEARTVPDNFVIPVNHKPVVTNDIASTPINTSIRMDVLSNDYDPDADFLTISSVSQPLHGTVTITTDSGGWNNRGVLYQPVAGFAGIDTFTYTASDGRGGTTQATVTVKVGPQVDLNDTVTSVNPTTVAAGDSLVVKHTASNLGGDATGSFRIGFYLSSDATIDSGDRFLGYITWSSIGSHGTQNYTTTVPLPADLSVGVYYVGTLIDYNNQITEADEGNNASEGVQIRIPGPPLFTAAADTVNFNHLTTNQLSAITGGADKYQALGGDDVVVLPDSAGTVPGGWSGLAFFDGGAGNDRITGGVLSDLIEGGAGNDTLAGGGNDDLFRGGAGSDGFDGGSGFDVVTYATSSAAIGVALGAGVTPAGDAVGDQFSNIEAIVGSNFADSIALGSVAMELHGNGGNDVIIGSSDGDWLYGENAITNPIMNFAGPGGTAGNDTIYGGSGADEIYGGAGNDTLYGGNPGPFFSPYGPADSFADKLDGGDGLDRYAVDGLDTIVNFQMNEKAFFTGGAEIDKIIAFASENGGTKLNFFQEGAAGSGKIGTLIFGNRVDLRDLDITIYSTTPSVVQIEQHLNVQARYADAFNELVTEIKYTVELLRPAGDALVSALISSAYQAALQPALDKLKTKLAVWLASSATSDDVLNAAAAFEKYADEGIKQLITDIIKKGEPSSEATDWAKALLGVVAIKAGLPGATVFVNLGEVAIKTGFEYLIQEMDREFETKLEREPVTREFLRLKDGVTIDLNNQVSDSGTGKWSTIVTVDALNAGVGSDWNDTVFTTLGDATLPTNVEDGFVLADPSGSAVAAIVATSPQILRGNGLDNLLVGNGGANVLDGGSGNDELYGGDGDDTLDGGDGNDLIDGGGGDNNDLRGGPGSDTFIFPSYGSIDGGSGHDVVVFKSEGSLVFGFFDFSGASIEALVGNGLPILGDAYDNILNFSNMSASHVPSIHGLEGNDQITGSSSRDYILGGDGNDGLTGGPARDILVGGAGRDRFDFNSVKESIKGSNRDQILDFSHQDDIDLRTIDAQSGGGNQAFKFIGKKDFSAKKGELHYIDRGATVIVQGDINGDGKADFEIFAKIGSLAKGDFLL